MLTGAEEACWAHNPKVLGLKPRWAMYMATFWFDLGLVFLVQWQGAQVDLTCEEAQAWYKLGIQEAESEQADSADFVAERSKALC